MIKHLITATDKFNYNKLHSVLKFFTQGNIIALRALDLFLIDKTNTDIVYENTPVLILDLEDVIKDKIGEITEENFPERHDFLMQHKFILPIGIVVGEHDNSLSNTLPFLYIDSHITPDEDSFKFQCEISLLQPFVGNARFLSEEAKDVLRTLKTEYFKWINDNFSIIKDEVNLSDNTRVELRYTPKVKNND